MKVDKELIEKYHLGLCTEEEQTIVEDWLLSEDVEDLILVPNNQTKDEIWSELVSSLPDYKQEQDKKQIRLFSIFNDYKYQAIAATLIIGLTALFFLVWKINSNELIAVNDSADLNKKKIDTKYMSITLAPKSRANVISKNQKGNIDFCGTIMINPKSDFQLTFNGQCTNQTAGIENETVQLKKGSTYIAVNYRYNSQSELIIVNERNLTNLPPLLLKEIMHQFNI